MNEFNDEFAGIPTTKPGWNDCTDVSASDRRKKSFKVYQKSPDIELLHVFTAGKYENIEYFHVIHEDFALFRPKPIAQYYLMTVDEIKEKFDLELK